MSYKDLYRVACGNSWYYVPHHMRRLQPSIWYPCDRNDFIGFRLTCVS